MYMSEYIYNKHDSECSVLELSGIRNSASKLIVPSWKWHMKMAWWIYASLQMSVYRGKWVYGFRHCLVTSLAPRRNQTVSIAPPCMANRCLAAASPGIWPPEKGLPFTRAICLSCKAMVELRASKWWCMIPKVNGWGLLTFTPQP